jgi:hypothetical protein
MIASNKFLLKKTSKKINEVWIIIKKEHDVTPY